VTLPADIGIVPRRVEEKNDELHFRPGVLDGGLRFLKTTWRKSTIRSDKTLSAMAERQGSPGPRVDHRSSPRSNADHDTMDIDHEMRNEWDYVQYQQDHSRTTSHRRLQSGTTDEDWHDCISSYNDDGIVGQSEAIHGTCLRLLHSGRHLPFSAICQMCTRLVLILHRQLLPSQEFLDSLAICELPVQDVGTVSILVTAAKPRHSKATELTYV
jgi:hypothetical protein